MSGLRATIKIAKAINRASKQAARNDERRRKDIEREKLRIIKEHERRLREEVRASKELERIQARLTKERERALREEIKAKKEFERKKIAVAKRKVLNAKQAFKEALNDSKLEYEVRCQERAELRKQYIEKVLK